MNASRVLITDDEPDMRWVLSRILRDHDFEVCEAPDGGAALALIEQRGVDVVLSDVRMPGMGGLELLERLAQHDADLPVILLTAVEDVATAVGAMKQGAFDYLQKPFDEQRLVATVRRAAEQRSLRTEVAQLREQLQARATTFGDSAQAHQLDETIGLIAEQTTLSVLILGESGTGKEVVAREIHRRSSLRDSAFVAVDCGALPEPLMESQLFGHRKGAFTGADRDRPGFFRMAHGGTLFLDELGNLPLVLQAKLLRALQERCVTPVGGTEPVPFEARLICATNADLREAVDRGEFRMDLYHRIAEFSIDLPPLRERPADLPGFAARFLAEANAEMGRRIAGISPDAIAEMQRHPWPGNLRELRNAVRRAVVTCSSATLEVSDLALARLRSSTADETASDPTRADAAPLDQTSQGTLTERVRRASEALEARILRQTLDEVGGNKAAAARALGIDYTTLHRKLKRHGLIGTMADVP